MKKKILLGVSGGIACYKSLELCRKFVDAKIETKVVMTESAKKFITPLSFQTLTQNSVGFDLFDLEEERQIGHINLSQSYDLILIAPATANLIAKAAYGIADDLLTTLLLAANCPIIMAPAMNDQMWKHATVRENLKKLESWGVRIIPPGTGFLACGSLGKGRLAEPDDIFEFVFKHFQTSREWEGKEFLVTGGGTKEFIDDFRYLSNPSSGKMGVAIAEEAVARGAKVTYISASGILPSNPAVQVIHAQSADLMAKHVFRLAPQADCVIQSAAVSDYQAEEIFPGKRKKGDSLECKFVPTIDILSELGKMDRKFVLVGFAAESKDLEKSVKEKFEKKKPDIIVGNWIGRKNQGFGSETNEGILWNGRKKTPIPNMKKSEFAGQILNEVREQLNIRTSISKQKNS